MCNALFAAALLLSAPLQKPGPAASQVPRIEGIQGASKMVPLKGHELDVLKGPVRRLRPIPPALTLDKDLRQEAMQRTGAPRDQLNRPTASVHAFTFLAEFIASKKMARNGVNLSEEYLNRLANWICGNNQDGDHLGNCLRAYMGAGICSEGLLPYRPVYNPGIVITAPMRAEAITFRRGVPMVIKPWLVGTVPPVNLPAFPAWPVVPGHGLSMPQLVSIRTQIGLGYPVAVSVRWPTDAAFATMDIAGVDVMKIPSVGQAPYSKGVALVGYKNDARFHGGGFFVFRNTEGPGWGDNGYGYMTFNYLRNLGLGAYLLK